MPADRAQEYERHCRSEVLPVLRGVAGFERARLLRRMTADDTEVVSLTVLNGLEAVRAVADLTTRPPSWPTKPATAGYVILDAV